jgi:hypothetical protein
MEWQLPIQKLEIGNVNIGSPWSRHNRPGTGADHMYKPMAPLSYFCAQFRMNFLSLLFPPLPVVEYNASTGKLVLDMSETSLGSIKLNTLQDTLLNAIVYHQMGWFKTEYEKSEIQAGFQPIIQDSLVHLHCPQGTMSQLQRSIPIFVDGKWKMLEGASSAQHQGLVPGVRIRVAVKIHGISFLMNQGSLTAKSWSGRCRIQHRIQGIIVCPDTANGSSVSNKPLSEK